VFKLGDITSLILLVYFGAGTLFVPVWVALAKRYEKHTVFCAAMIYAMLALSLYTFAANVGLVVIMAMNLLYGLVYGAGIFLVRAMVADAADEDALTHGTPRMGVFFASLSLTGKIGFALGPAIAYNFLEHMGFDPKGTVDSASADWLLFTFVVPPALMFGLAGLIIRRHSLTRAKHAQIQAALEVKAHARVHATDQ
jgi:Na+/melibiose symporter-like transporter